MASDSAGIKMDMQRKNRKDRKFLASIVFVMMSLSFSPMVALHAQQAARGRGGPPAGPVKRRPDGKPDISGYYNSPNAGGAAFNVEAGPAAVGQPATQGAITDPPDKLIPYTTAAKAKREELLAHHLYDDPEAHCLPSGIPRQTYAPFGWQILQPDGYVVMIYEAFHAYRILPLDGRPHLPANVRLWEGDGRARWDGDTLVVDTTNQTGKQWFDMAGNFSTPTLHVFEHAELGSHHGRSRCLYAAMDDFSADHEEQHAQLSNPGICLPRRRTGSHPLHAGRGEPDRRESQEEVASAPSGGPPKLSMVIPRRVLTYCVGNLPT